MARQVTRPQNNLKRMGNVGECQWIEQRCANWPTKSKVETFIGDCILKQNIREELGSTICIVYFEESRNLGRTAVSLDT